VEFRIKEYRRRTAAGTGLWAAWCEDFLAQVKRNQLTVPSYRSKEFENDGIY